MNIKIKNSDNVLNSSVIWDKFIKKNNGSPYHLYGWKEVFKKTYNLKTFYLMIYEENDLIGVAPFVIINPLFIKRKRAISIPYSGYAGIILKDESRYQDIIDKLLIFFRHIQIFNVEVRYLSSEKDEGDEFTMLLKLPKNSEIL